MDTGTVKVTLTLKVKVKVRVRVRVRVKISARVRVRIRIRVRNILFFLRHLVCIAVPIIITPCGTHKLSLLIVHTACRHTHQCQGYRLGLSLELGRGMHIICVQNWTRFRFRFRVRSS